MTDDGAIHSCGADMERSERENRITFKCPDCGDKTHVPPQSITSNDGAGEADTGLDSRSRRGLEKEPSHSSVSAPEPAAVLYLRDGDTIEEAEDWCIRQPEPEHQKPYAEQRGWMTQPLFAATDIARFAEEDPDSFYEWLQGFDKKK